VIYLKKKLKEYLRLGRLFNAEIMSLILVLSYALSAKLYDIQIDARIIVALFFCGIFAHIWGAYNNDRMDLNIDKDAAYCSHKPLVTGSISIKTVKIVEYSSLIIFVGLIMLSLYLSSLSFFSISALYTYFYLLGAVTLAALYNRFNKSNMLINITGQMYASFVVLIGMSIIVDFGIIVFLSALVMGLNGVYLNIIEADLKDIEGDIVNVPKALGVRFKAGKALNVTKFYLLNEAIKITMFLLIIFILFLEKASFYYIVLACVLFVLNCFVRISMFKHLSPDREKMKRHIAIQEITSILLISTIYMIIHPLLPILVVIFIAMWLVIWNKLLWRTYLRPQV
jgi:4-hydroxybenzoate polyprenyltransferase